MPAGKVAHLWKFKRIEIADWVKIGYADVTADN
jgi:hypothetical protein